jgi:ribosomal protein S18 acetylase RimI-like enzyme
MQTRDFQDSDRDAVVELWGKCGITRPWNDPIKDIARHQAVADNWFLIGEQNGRVVASVMAGYDGHRGWIYYLAVDPQCQRSGYGREIMTAAEGILRDAGCPKVNLQVRRDNLDVIDFYQRLGFSEDNVASFGKRLIADA